MAEPILTAVDAAQPTPAAVAVARRPGPTLTLTIFASGTLGVLLYARRCSHLARHARREAHLARQEAEQWRKMAFTLQPIAGSSASARPAANQPTSKSATTSAPVKRCSPSSVAHQTSRSVVRDHLRRSPVAEDEKFSQLCAAANAMQWDSHPDHAQSKLDELRDTNFSLAQKPSDSTAAVDVKQVELAPSSPQRALSLTPEQLRQQERFMLGIFGDSVSNSADAAATAREDLDTELGLEKVKPKHVISAFSLTPEQLREEERFMLGIFGDSVNNQEASLNAHDELDAELSLAQQSEIQPLKRSSSPFSLTPAQLREEERFMLGIFGEVNTANKSAQGDETIGDLDFAQIQGKQKAVKVAPSGVDHDLEMAAHLAVLVPEGSSRESQSGGSPGGSQSGSSSGGSNGRSGGSIVQGDSDLHRVQPAQALCATRTVAGASKSPTQGTLQAKPASHARSVPDPISPAAALRATTTITGSANPLTRLVRDAPLAAAREDASVRTATAPPPFFAPTAREDTGRSSRSAPEASSAPPPPSESWSPLRLDSFADWRRHHAEIRERLRQQLDADGFWTLHRRHGFSAGARNRTRCDADDKSHQQREQEQPQTTGAHSFWPWMHLRRRAGRHGSSSWF